MTASDYPRRQKRTCDANCIHPPYLPDSAQQVNGSNASAILPFNVELIRRDRTNWPVWVAKVESRGAWQLTPLLIMWVHRCMPLCTLRDRKERVTEFEAGKTHDALRGKTWFNKQQQLDFRLCQRPLPSLPFFFFISLLKFAADWSSNSQASLAGESHRPSVSITAFAWSALLSRSTLQSINTTVTMNTRSIRAQLRSKEEKDSADEAIHNHEEQRSCSVHQKLTDTTSSYQVCFPIAQVIAHRSRTNKRG